MPNETHVCISISNVNVNVFWLRFGKSITFLLEYTVHLCQVDLTHYVSNISIGRRNFRTPISCIGILKTGLSRNDFLYTLMM